MFKDWTDTIRCANWKQAANILEAIRIGHVSEPLGLSLYFHIATNKNNLPIYKCFRGTNSVEGGINQNVIHNFTSFNDGPQLTDAILIDYILRYNTKNYFHFEIVMQQYYNTCPKHYGKKSKQGEQGEQGEQSEQSELVI
ncbi:hypothetical protein INT45_005518 [Circinella minor]|uniref:Uncharacterized protein n=1 Tax=Circinella minor TaxID=1195481 RepID=A0A8H7RLL8_9FUNG|nr:hypothetical protein INT45_005518 [Circinella minor]